MPKFKRKERIKQMIKSKITLSEVTEAIEQFEAFNKLNSINMPTATRHEQYNSLKPIFDKLQGSRSRCFTACMFKHEFAELAKAEAEARGTKLSENDCINLFERLSQIIYSYFAEHSKGDLRQAYKTQYENYKRLTYKK